MNFDYLEEVEFSPVFALGTGSGTVEFTEQDYDDYDYHWRITDFPTAQDTARTTIGTGRTLSTTINSLPASGYNLALYMKHKRTGMQHNFYWGVTVNVEDGLLSAGLLVADTRDELTSDISLIRSYHYSANRWDNSGRYEWIPGMFVAVWVTREDIILRDVYSRANSGPLDGLISSLFYTHSFNPSQSTWAEIGAVVKGRSYTRMEQLTMRVMDRDEQIFWAAPENFNPQMAFSLPRNSYQLAVLINDGRPYTYVPTEENGRFSALLDNGNDYEIAENIVVPVSVFTTARSLFFDKKGGKIITLHSSNTIPRRGFEDLPAVAAGSVFDHNRLSNFDCLHASYFNTGTTNDPDHRSIWLLRDKTTGKLYIYELQTTEDRNNDWVFTVRGLNIFDMSNCAELENATCYTSTYNFREFYYAVGNKIYASILSLGVSQPTSKVVFETTDPNEVITHMEAKLNNVGWTYWNPPMPAMGNTLQNISSQNNLITIATYNEATGEGKVYAIPRQYQGSGEFAAREYVSEWGGFGRITAIALRE